MSKKDITSKILKFIFGDQPAEKYKDNPKTIIHNFNQLPEDICEELYIYFKDGYEKEIELKKFRESKIGQILSTGAIVIALTSTMYLNIPTQISFLKEGNCNFVSTAFFFLSGLNFLLILWFGLKFREYLQGHSHSYPPNPSKLYERYTCEIPTFLKQKTIRKFCKNKNLEVPIYGQPIKYHEDVAAFFTELYKNDFIDKYTKEIPESFKKETLENFDYVKDFKDIRLKSYYISYLEWRKINLNRQELLYNIQRILYIILAVSFITFIFYSIGKITTNT